MITNAHKMKKAHREFKQGRNHIIYSVNEILLSRDVKTMLGGAGCYCRGARITLRSGERKEQREDISSNSPCAKLKQ